MQFLNFNLFKRIFVILMISAVASTEAAAASLEIIERNKHHKLKFYEALESQVTEQLLKSKASKSRLLDAAAYKSLMDEIETARNTKNKKTSRQYYLLGQYEVYKVSEISKIIAKRDEKNPDIRYLVPYDDVFDAIHFCHKTVGHKGEI